MTECQKRKIRKDNHCIDCGKLISVGAIRCGSCARKGKNNPMFDIHLYGEKNGMYGKYHTFKTIQKIKKNKSNQYGENNPFYNKHHTEETKQKIRKNKPNQSGKNNPNWNNHKLAGRNHPNWKGGITSLTILIRKSKQYKQWRLAVFTKDNFTCQDCGNSINRDLNAHHDTKSFAQILEENNIKTLEQAKDCKELWNIENGECLCEDCHIERHTKKAKIEGFVLGRIYQKQLDLFKMERENV